MKPTYRLYQRSNGTFYAQHNQTGRQSSLGTRDPHEAERILAARNEASLSAHTSRAVGMAYLSAADPAALTRTWGWVLAQILASKAPETETHRRWGVAVNDKAFSSLENLLLLDTRAEHFLDVLKIGTVSTNVYLRKVHNFALDMGWLPRPVIAKRQWPRIRFKKKRPITTEEHRRIVERESNPERRDFYELLWYFGASQSDLALLEADAIDWNARVVRFFRCKTGSFAAFAFGDEVAEILRRRPATGRLFPYLATVRAGDRATEFKQRCLGLAIKGITLHCYRYGWAARARKVGFPLRFAQLALGHNSKAVHAAYAGHEEVTLPCLQDYERKAPKADIVVAPPA